MWLKLLVRRARFHRYPDAELVRTQCPAPWTQKQRLQYLRGAVVAYQAAAADFEGNRKQQLLDRGERALVELLLISRYQKVDRRSRLSLLSLEQVRRSGKTIGAQLLAGVLPQVSMQIKPERVNLRPQTATMDFLSTNPLHNCATRSGSLCHSEPLVTIAIPSYNHGRFLKTAISSALQQTYRNIEVVVVDDGSTDETPQIVQGFGDAIRSFRHANSGPARTYNFAAQTAHGTYLAFLDADDAFHPLYVQELLGGFCESEDASLGFVYCQMALFGRENRITWYPQFDSNELRYGNYVNSSALFKLEALRQVAFDSDLPGLEDWDLFLSLTDRGWGGKLVDLPLLKYRTHVDVESRSATVRSRRRQRAIRASVKAKHKQVILHPQLHRRKMYAPYRRGDIE